MSQPRRAVITGMGAVSGFGAGAALLWEALVEGKRAMSSSPLLEHLGLEGVLGAVPTRDADGPPAELAEVWALRAAAEAIAAAGGVEAGDGLALALGTTLGGIGPWLEGLRGARPWSEVRRWTWSGPAQVLAAAHGVGGPVVVTSVACASSNSAFGVALDLIRSGRASQVIAGGVDVLSDFVIAGFASLKAVDPQLSRPFDRTRRGLNLGEGACFLIVEEEQAARRRGAPIRAYLDGYGASADAVHMTGPDRAGRGAARAMLAALADADASPEQLGFISAHGTGTSFNDLMEAKALELVLGDHSLAVPVNSIKSALGHTLGAAGAFEALMCVRTLESGILPPTPGLTELDAEMKIDVIQGAARRDPSITLALSTSSGFGGSNTSIVLRKVV